MVGHFELLVVITSSPHAKNVNQPLLALKTCLPSGVRHWIYWPLLFYVPGF